MSTNHFNDPDFLSGFVNTAAAAGVNEDSCGELLKLAEALSQGVSSSDFLQAFQKEAASGITAAQLKAMANAAQGAKARLASKATTAPKPSAAPALNKPKPSSSGDSLSTLKNLGLVGGGVGLGALGLAGAGAAADSLAELNMSQDEVEQARFLRTLSESSRSPFEKDLALASRNKAISEQRKRELIALGGLKPSYNLVNPY